MEDGFDYQTAIEEFQDERPVWKQIWAAIITEFTPDKKNWFGAAFSFVLALILWREYCCSHTSHIHLERYMNLKA